MSEPMPGDITCYSPLRDDLKAYLDDELAPPVRRLVQSHLRICAVCAKELLMLQTTQTRLQGESREQAPPVELHQRILTQIKASGINDERLRRERMRGGLIPRRYLPFAIALSTLITAVALFPMVAHLREKARQANAIANGRQIGFAMTQYYQDYDEKFLQTSPPVNGQVIYIESTGHISDAMQQVTHDARVHGGIVKRQSANELAIAITVGKGSTLLQDLYVMKSVHSVVVRTKAFGPKANPLDTPIVITVYFSMKGKINVHKLHRS